MTLPINTPFFHCVASSYTSEAGATLLSNRIRSALVFSCFAEAYRAYNTMAVCPLC